MTGRRLCEWRLRLGWTAERFRLVFGLSRVALWNRENGKRKLPLMLAWSDVSCLQSRDEGS